MSLPIIALPVLDGRRETTDARLDAWSRSAEDYAIEDALYGAREALTEATTAALAVRGNRETVAELTDQLSQLGAALIGIEHASGRLQGHALGGAA